MKHEIEAYISDEWDIDPPGARRVAIDLPADIKTTPQRGDVVVISWQEPTEHSCSETPDAYTIKRSHAAQWYIYYKDSNQFAFGSPIPGCPWCYTKLPD